jgi:serine/threonine-protein kinase
MDESSADRLLDSIAGSDLVAPEATPALGLLRTEFRDPDGLAQEMVRRQWLTPFQADRLLNDRVEELVIGPYALLEPLGEGGMGRVYKARHRLMNRVVALKVIRTELVASVEARARFQREIEAAARVWHPNLVAALDALPVGDGLVLVMEFVEGETLASVLAREGPAPIRHACDWCRQAALGLGHAHEQGLIHRDVKPSNLILTARGNLIKVTDLGLARLDLLAERRDPDGGPLTDSNAVVGTPDYMAPEQAIAPSEAGPEADLYSLGCTLFHLLTGRPPFPGGSLTQKLLWHQKSEPPDPSRVRPSIPAGLSQAVLKMMAKRPDQRYRTAAEAATALEPYCSAASLKTLPVEAPPRRVDAVVESSGSSVSATTVVRHEPHESTAYDLAEGDDADADVEAAAPTEISAPEPPPLAHPASPGDDSWWRDEVAATRAARPQPRQPRALHPDPAPTREPRAPDGLKPLVIVAGVSLLLLICVAALVASWFLR